MFNFFEQKIYEKSIGRLKVGFHLNKCNDSGEALHIKARCYKQNILKWSGLLVSLQLPKVYHTENDYDNLT